ncbi:hypothetical protein GCM10027360_07560 [Amycolatopsis echigonensis]
MVALAAVDPRPYPAHRAPDLRACAIHATDDLAGIALHSDLFALPNRRPSRRGVPGGEASYATKRQPPESHTQHPWATQPYERLDQPDQEGRAACPGYVATDFNGYAGTRTPEQGAAIAVKLATLPDDGPRGGFFDDAGEIPW